MEFFRDTVEPDQYKTWFEPISFVSYEGGKVTINVPSSFFADTIDANFIPHFKAALHKNFGPGTRLGYTYPVVQNDPEGELKVESELPSPAVKPQASNPFQTEAPRDIDSQLNPVCTFENYCASPSNMVARSIAEAIANDPNCKTFNPFFLFGPTGVGKTHLIQAIGIRIKERNPRARVLYVTARLFESQYTNACATGKVNDFIYFYQSIEVLIIDDIQDLIGKKATQNAFFHIFNYLHQNQRQIILSSDTQPAMMEGMADRMLSRFNWGATIELSKPDIDLRREVLTQKAAHDGLTLPPDVMEFIVANATSSIREIEGVVVSLLAHATVLNREITLDLAKAVMGNSVRLQRRVVNFEAIAREVGAYYDISQDKLFAKTRKREIADARQIVMYLAKKHAKMALTAIGVRSGRTHATVLHACKNIEERMCVEKQLRDDIAKIESAL